MPIAPLENSKPCSLVISRAEPLLGWLIATTCLHTFHPIYLALSVPTITADHAPVSESAAMPQLLLLTPGTL